MSRLSKQLTRRLKGIQKILMAHHQAGSLFPNAAKGAEREALVRNFLQLVFPATFRFGSGAITDASGAASGQLDIVVEFPFFPSFPTPAGAERMYLADSVAFVIDVKSDLRKQWKDVEGSVSKVKVLRRHWLSHAGTGSDARITQFPATTSWIPYVVVGFCGNKSVDSLQRRIEQAPEDKRPDAALVIESGAYVGHQFRTPRVRASDAAGLFGFCVDANYLACNVLVAAIDVSKYLGRK